MTIRCRVSAEDKAEPFDFDLAAVPRVGEHASLPIDGEMQEFRVTRVVYAPADGMADTGLITVEVTSKIL